MKNNEPINKESQPVEVPAAKFPNKSKATAPTVRNFLFAKKLAIDSYKKKKTDSLPSGSSNSTEVVPTCFTSVLDWTLL
jgi:hypothetical protein